MLPAQAPEFTTDSVLQSLARTHPQATRVSDKLPAGVVAREDLTYVKRQGGALRLDVYRPADKRRLPAVLIVHGGGWIAGDRRMERPLAMQLAARGYVAVPVSYRLGHEGRFPAPIHDLRCAVQWLRRNASEYDINPAQIAIIGGSAGGTLALTVGAANGEKELREPDSSEDIDDTVQAVIDIDGTASFLDNSLIEQSETKPSPYWEYVHGPYAANRAAWVAASPINHVTRRSAPTLFIKSTATQPRLAGREEMAARLRLLGIDAQELTLDGTPHPFWLVHPWFEKTLAATDAFLAQQLKEKQ